MCGDARCAPFSLSAGSQNPGWNLEQRTGRQVEERAGTKERLMPSMVQIYGNSTYPADTFYIGIVFHQRAISIVSTTHSFSVFGADLYLGQLSQTYRWGCSSRGNWARRDARGRMQRNQRKKGTLDSPPTAITAAAHYLSQLAVTSRLFLFAAIR